MTSLGRRHVHHYYHDFIPVVVLIISLTISLMSTRVEAGDGTPHLQFDLRKLTDVLKVKLTEDGNKNTDKLGSNNFRLVTGNEYVVDPSDDAAPSMKIIVEDWKFHTSQAFYHAQGGMQLCTALPDEDVNYSDCNIATAVVNIDGSNRPNYARFTFSLRKHDVRTAIFPMQNGRRAAYRKLLITAKLNPVFEKYFHANDKIKTRPLPLFTILFKNAEVLKPLYDSRNGKMCESAKHRYLNIDTFSDKAEFETGPKGHAGPTTTKFTGGVLKVYTPNKRIVKLESAFACRTELYQAMFRCNHRVWDVSFTWLPKVIESVDAAECRKWQETRQCTVFRSNLTAINHTETMNMSQVTRNQFRTNVTDNTLYTLFDRHVSKHVMYQCVNRVSGLMYVRNCILDTDVPVTYSFPYQSTTGGKRLVTPFGALPVGYVLNPTSVSSNGGVDGGSSTASDEKLSKVSANSGKDDKYGWVKMNTSSQHPHMATLMWFQHEVDSSFKFAVSADICPFTTLMTMPVNAVITDNLQHTDIGISHGHNVRKMITFIENTADLLMTPHRMKVYDNHRLNDEDVKRMKLSPGTNNRCMHPAGEIYQTFLIDGTILLQFIDDSQILQVMRSNHWNRSKRKNTVKRVEYQKSDGKNVVGLSDSLQTTASDLDEAVCTGTRSTYKDGYEHIWQCVNGIPTLVTIGTAAAVVPAFSPPPNPTQPKEATFMDLHTGVYWPGNDLNGLLGAFTSDQTKFLKHILRLNARLHNVNENEKWSKTNIFERVGALEPDLMTKTLFSDEHVKITRAGDYWAVHRCEPIDWKDVRVLPSLRLDHKDMPAPSLYRNIGLKSGATHLADVCYSTPIVKIKHAELGVIFAQVLDGGSEYSRDLNLLSPCKRSEGVMKFDIGDQVITFSASTGKLLRVSSRYTHPLSPFFNHLHRTNYNPIEKNIETGSSHVSGAMTRQSSAPSVQVYDMMVGTDQDYVPKPEETSDIYYRTHGDSSIRHHLNELTLEQSLTPKSASNFLSLIDGKTVNRLNEERYKREERHNIPAWHWPYEDTSLPNKLPITDAEKMPAYGLENGGGFAMMQENGQHSETRDGRHRFSAPRQLPKPGDNYVRDSLFYRGEQFIEQYGEIMIGIVVGFVCVSVPVLLCMVCSYHAESKQMLQQIRYSDKSASGYHYITGAAIGAPRSHYESASTGRDSTTQDDLILERPSKTTTAFLYAKD